MRITRAKFTCESILLLGNQRKVTLRAVSGGTPEDNQFSKWTPSGVVEIYISNPSAFDVFEVGKKYYADFSKADE